jgi:ankyrin repeat protein
MSKNSELVKFVFENGGSETLMTLGSHGMSPFLYSCQAGDAESVAFLWQKLCERGAAHMMHETGVNGDSTLKLAVKAGSEPTVRFLLDNGAQIKEGFGPSATLLHAAAGAGSVATYQLLESGGVTSQSKYKGYDSSLLHMAVKSGNPEMVDYLFKTRQVSASDMNGGALHDAVSGKNIAMLQTLLKYDTRLMINEPYGSYPQRTPLQLALDFNFIHIAKLLFEHGANIPDLKREEVGALIDERIKKFEEAEKLKKESPPEVLDEHLDVDPDRAKCSIM